MKARHSVTLLGLKPSNMRPVHQQYRTYDIPQQMTGSQQALTQVNPQETPQQQQQQQQQAAATPSSQPSNPSDAENIQRSIFLQDHLQPQQFRLEQRKYPELRPLSAGQSSPIVAKSDDHLAARTTSMVSINLSAGKSDLLNSMTRIFSTPSFFRYRPEVITRR